MVSPNPVNCFIRLSLMFYKHIIAYALAFAIYIPLQKKNLKNYSNIAATAAATPSSSLESVTASAFAFTSSSAFPIAMPSPLEC